jgi:hypothetical protein
MLKAYMPTSVFRPIRAVATAFLTPIRFSKRTGHFRSSLAEAAISPSGDPLPWYTYPCIDLLSQKSFAGRSVLEFGSGQSTLWWSKQAAKVTAFENDPAWYERVKKSLPANARVNLISDWYIHDDPLKDGNSFDIIIVDGLDRVRATELAISHISSGGAIIIDNSEGFWSEDGSSYPIIDMLNKNGFQRVDFYGFAPGVVKRSCTSIAFRNSCFLFSQAAPPARFD